MINIRFGISIHFFHLNRNISTEMNLPINGGFGHGHSEDQPQTSKVLGTETDNTNGDSCQRTETLDSQHRPSLKQA